MLAWHAGGLWLIPRTFGYMPVIPPPGQWRQVGQRFKLFLLDILKFKNNLEYRRHCFQKRKIKEQNSQLLSLCPYHLNKNLTGLQGTKKGRIWKTLYQMYGPITKVVQS